MVRKQSRQLWYGALALLLLFSFIVQASAVPVVAAWGVYRVAPGGTDIAGCGTEGQPCRTLQYAVDLAASGDVIKVAAGTYTRSGPSPIADCNIGSTNADPVVCVVNKHLTLQGGYRPDDWDNADPEANPTVVDGQNNSRGIVIIGWSDQTATASLVLEGFTIQQGLALGASSGDDVVIGGYGGGLYATNAPVTVRKAAFQSNRAVGGNTTQTYGGTAAGGALAINGMPPGTVCVLEQVAFAGNQALGGQGRDRGGTAIGGGLYVDTANIHSSQLVFYDNVARAGSSSGGGRDTIHDWTADGLGGGAAIHVSSDAKMEDVVATGNQAIGGNAGIEPGAGHGGAIYAEHAVFELEEADLRQNKAIGGNGVNGYVGGGGALMVSESSMSLERSVVVGNEAWGGNGTTGRTGAAGGGGLYLLRTSTSTVSISISNSIIAENLIVEGAGATLSGGGGGGLWLQGVQANITHTTIARNRLGDTLIFGMGAIVVNFGCQRPSVVDMDYSIVEGHTGGWGAALHVWEGNTLNLNRCLFAANSKNTNADGTVTGLSTCVQTPSAGFVAPGSPEHDYHLDSTSPAIDQAAASTMTEDIDGETRPQGQAPDIGADEFNLDPLSLEVRRPESGSLALSWQLASSLLAYLDHYELQVSAEPGAAPPREGGLEVPIDLGQETTFVLTGLTDGKEYTLELVAYDASNTAFAETSVTATPARIFHTYLPLTLGR